MGRVTELIGRIGSLFAAPEARRRGFRPAIDGLEGRWLLTTLPKGFAQSVVAQGLVRPSGMAMMPDGRILVIQQTGEVRVIRGGRLLPSPMLTVKTDAAGERGLLGIAVNPNFKANPSIFLYYTVPGSPAHNRVSRFRVSGDVADPASEADLLDLPALGDVHHNGGSLQFGKDHKLYIGVGDNRVSSNAQSLATPFGKVLRINADGTIPADNPFYNQTTGVNRAIWAVGLRNPFSMAVQPRTGRLFINDVGESTWEKIDRGARGANYGWPITENATGDPRFTAPLYAYDHGPAGVNGAAITGGVFYNPARPRFPRSFAGRYFFADIEGWVKVYNPANGAVRPFATGLAPNVDALNVDAAGNLYVLSQGDGPAAGTLVRIRFGRR
ncbi:Soluble aldose sugar dehydrogenase YliI precursor [Aquisphaera giovannonii]|uniref:Soluble aldose sugar dehydrogenase YliI n=1 Tax=Aquisphaera giovannonii TaxID=406548 RepID=A0A5B9WBQ9_9BACT|nr:PQQ-dependent sugar dehydrogenase [Aquisphaera giovannonii]QEH37649.1 Soluble aldose sugar dehydrogenase YliI precursor [Aquisphaera giovannonii]